MFLFAEFEFVAFLREIELTLAGGFALVGNLQACLFTEVGEFEALGVAEREGVLFFLFAIFVGEDAVEVFEQGWAGFWGGGEFEGALFDDLEAGGVQLRGAGGVEVAEMIDGGLGVGGIFGDVIRQVFSDLELVGEVELGAVAVEGGDGKVGAEVHVELLLDVFQGAGAEEIVDEIELVRAQVGELGEGLEGTGALAALGDF